MKKKAPSSLRNSWGPGRAHRTYTRGERAMLWTRILKRFFKKLMHVDMRKLIARGRKWLQLRRKSHSSTKKLPVFIVGCNRSGTNMVCEAIGLSPHGWDYRERALSLAFNGFYLRADWIIERLIRHTPAPIVSFGSILDSQFTNDLLSRFEGAKAIWVYRRFEDVVNSCVRQRWGEHQRNLARWVAQGELEKLGARGKNISNDTVQLFGKLFHEDLSDEDAACFYWYMRNQLYFDLNLHTNPRVLIVQYEDTVLNEEKAFRRIFDFLGFPYHPEVISAVFASSVGKHTIPKISPAIKEVCDILKIKLDERYARTSDWIPEDRDVSVEQSQQN
jgi:hypothetical protein